jgi:hypothetical protein
MFFTPFLQIHFPCKDAKTAKFFLPRITGTIISKNDYTKLSSAAVDFAEGWEQSRLLTTRYEYSFALSCYTNFSKRLTNTE